MIELLKAIAPILAAIIVIGGGAWTYAYQRSIDRADKLREKRQETYEKYLHTLFVAGTRADPAKNADNDAYQTAKLSIFVMVPDTVVREGGAHQKLIQQGPGPERNEKSEAFAKLILAMRADSFEKSKLTIDEVIALSPLSHH